MRLLNGGGKDFGELLNVFDGIIQLMAAMIATCSAGEIK